VILIRHGQTDWSRVGRHTGWRDIPLNDEGVAQAQALRPWLDTLTINRVLCSPLSRAMRTCDECGRGEGAEIDPDLREWNYGEYEGRTRDEIRAARSGWDIWKDGVVNGETADGVGVRADRVIASLRASASDGLSAVFAHGHFLRILASRWVGVDAGFGKSLFLGTAGVGLLGYEHDNPVLTGWNWS
jgi:probable phosphoglycerate mutase